MEHRPAKTPDPSIESCYAQRSVMHSTANRDVVNEPPHQNAIHLSLLQARHRRKTRFRTKESGSNIKADVATVRVTVVPNEGKDEREEAACPGLCAITRAC